MPRTGLEEREHDDDEIRVLPKERQPVPFEPYGLNAPARGQGQGLSRRSPTGDRWCPFCQTPLFGQRQSCRRCHPIRLENVQQGRVQAAPPEPASQEPVDELGNLLAVIDEMSRVIGVSSAYQNRGGGLSGPQVEDIFMACKDVMVASDALRRTRRTAD